MRSKLPGLVVSVGMLLAAGPVVAHHAFSAEFDANKPIKLKGTVTRVEFINPHSWIHVDVKGPDGKLTNWMVEGGAPTGLFRRGITKEDLAVGTELVIDGFQAKDDSKRVNGRDVTLADGKRLFLGSSGTGAPADGRDPTEKK